MAIVAPTITDIAGDGSIVVMKWELTTADYEGAPVAFTQWADKTVQVEGTFGGATCQLQGSNDLTNFQALRSPLSSTPLSITTAAGSAGLSQILEVTQVVKPILSAVGSGAALTVTLCCRRANPMRT